jgi:hypothetical protein
MPKAQQPSFVCTAVEHATLFDPLPPKRQESTNAEKTT